jgi:hypothetical protein
MFRKLAVVLAFALAVPTFALASGPKRPGSAPATDAAAPAETAPAAAPAEAAPAATKNTGNAKKPKPKAKTLAAPKAAP